MCGSARLNGVDLHIHVHEPPQCAVGTNGKVEKNYEKVSKLFSEGDGGAKDTSRSGSCKISKRSKIEKCVDCLCAHGSHSEKCDTWAKARERNRTLTLQIPTMQILMSQILCVGKIGSRRAAACGTIIPAASKLARMTEAAERHASSDAQLSE